MNAPIASFQDVLDDGYLACVEAQRRVVDAVGAGTPYDGRFDVDLQAGILTFTGTQALAVRAHFLGSAAPGPRSWLWGWQNLNGFPDPVVAYVRHVCDFGAQAGLAELTVAEQPLQGSPREDAVRYATAASVICGGLPHYTFEVGGGSIGALLIDSPAFAAGPASALRASTVLPEAAAAGVIVDWRRALTSYAGLRGFAFHQGPTALTLTAPDGSLDVTLDDLGRLARVEAQLQAAAG